MGGFFTDMVNQKKENTGIIAGTLKYNITIGKNGCPGIPANAGVKVQQANKVVAVPPTHAIQFGSQNTAIILTPDIPGASLLFSATAMP
ncbi:MAG: hypothetical protein NTW10_07750 [Bacteroidetes bacterium]|nr:hypothetical protein [Bacteroidota bacterium]